MAAFASFNIDEFLCYGIWDTGATGAMAGLGGMLELFNSSDDVLVDNTRSLTLTFANGERTTP